MAALALGACGSSPKATDRSLTPTTVASLDTAPPACSRLEVSALRSLGHAVVLNRTRSVTTKIARVRTDIHCVFDDATTKAEVGSVGLTSYPSATASRSAFEATRQSDSGLGLSTTPESYGQEAFALDQGSSWSCLILSDSVISSGALAGTDATTACRWAQLGLEMQ
jgi:hypothetical protein